MSPHVTLLVEDVAANGGMEDEVRLQRVAGIGGIDALDRALDVSVQGLGEVHRGHGRLLLNAASMRHPTRVGQDADMLLKACLNGARRPGTHHQLPITPEECAREGAAAVRAGAGALHVHIRGADGLETFDAGHIAASLDAMRAAVNVPIGVSTGAWVIPDPAERVAAIKRWTTQPDFASVNFHEDGAADVARALISNGVGVEAGLWNADSARALIASGLADQCLRIMLEPINPDLDVTLETLAGLDDALDGVAPAVPRLLHGHGATAWAVLALAGERGEHSRIGLEDTLMLPDGSAARDNADLVDTALELLGR